MILKFKWKSQRTKRADKIQEEEEWGGGKGLRGTREGEERRRGEEEEGEGRGSRKGKRGQRGGGQREGEGRGRGRKRWLEDWCYPMLGLAVKL